MKQLLISVLMASILPVAAAADNGVANVPGVHCFVPSHSPWHVCRPSPRPWA